MKFDRPPTHMLIKIYNFQHSTSLPIFIFLLKIQFHYYNINNYNTIFNDKSINTIIHVQCMDLLQRHFSLPPPLFLLHNLQLPSSRRYEFWFVLVLRSILKYQINYIVHTSSLGNPILDLIFENYRFALATVIGGIVIKITHNHLILL